MKKGFFTLVFLICSFNSFAQYKHQISVQSSFFTNSIVRFANLDGAASYEHQNSFSVGIGYQYFFTNRYSLKPEIHWQSSLLTSNNISTTGSNVRQDIKLQTINIPVLLSYLLNDYFYLEAGPVLHFETLSTPEQYINPQNGLGFSLGIGLRHSFSGFTVFAKPNIHLLSLLPFKSENYHQRLLSAGFTFGFGYNF